MAGMVSSWNRSPCTTFQPGASNGVTSVQRSASHMKPGSSTRLPPPPCSCPDTESPVAIASDNQLSLYYTKNISFGLEPLYGANPHHGGRLSRSEEHTSELQSLMRISYAVFCLKKKKKKNDIKN